MEKKKKRKILLGCAICIVTLLLIPFFFGRARNEIKEDKQAFIKLGIRSNQQDRAIALLDLSEILLLSLAWVSLGTFLLLIPVTIFIKKPVSHKRVCSSSEEETGLDEA